MTQNEMFLKGVELKSNGYPIMVFSRNLRSWLGSSISTVTKGTYNHFMWMVSEKTVATQDNFFHSVPIEDYMKGEHILKFVIDTRWTVQDMVNMLRAIHSDLQKPWYNRFYDYLAIFGQLIHQTWIQIPWLDICSERGKYLRMSDKDYNLKHPSPSDINRYQKEHQATPENGMKGYLVIDRWYPEDL